MKDFQNNEEEYTWNKWAIYVVSTLQDQSEDLKNQGSEINELKSEIALLKSLKLKEHLDDYLVFKTTILTRVKVTSTFISIAIAILGLIIQIVLLMGKLSK